VCTRWLRIRNLSMLFCDCCRKVNLREMKVRQKQERHQIEQYDQQSQARREALITTFDREKQVLLHAHTRTPLFYGHHMGQTLLAGGLAHQVKN